MAIASSDEAVEFSHTWQNGKAVLRMRKTINLGDIGIFVAAEA
jgi:hypothetical protein